VDSGSFEVFLTFSMSSLPVKLVSNDEAHPLFSYSDYGSFGIVDLCWIGVSPSGRIITKAMDGAQN
jgi:hypothetical protein